MFLWNCHPLVFCVFSCVSVGTMLSRGARTGGYDLPGAESTAVPLIGYRPLSHDSSSLGDPLGRDSSSNKVKTAQVHHPVVTWAMRRYNIYCVPCLFVLIWVCSAFPVLSLVLSVLLSLLWLGGSFLSLIVDTCPPSPVCGPVHLSTLLKVTSFYCLTAFFWLVVCTLSLG